MLGMIPMSLMVICNLWASIGLFFQRNYPLALVFLCYAISTCGLMWASK